MQITRLKFLTTVVAVAMVCTTTRMATGQQTDLVEEEQNTEQEWTEVGCIGQSIWKASSSNPPGIEILAPATVPMEFAASELVRYLGQILGTPLSVKPSSTDKPRILIEKVTDNDLGDEGYEIRVEGKTIRIRGGGDLGVLYGVYEFLRRYGGCRFSGLGLDGELVPSRKEIVATNLPLIRKPKLWYRGPQFTSRGPDGVSEEESVKLCVEWIDWMAKNGFNYIMYNPWIVDGAWFDRYIRPEMLKRGLKFDMNHHNLGNWLPAKQYYAEHPEWFPMLDGKRITNGQQLAICSSNPDAVQAVINNVKTYIREHPEVSIIGVIPEDGTQNGLCHCDECTKLDVANGIDPQEQYRNVSFSQDGKGNLAKTRRYTLLVNQVARSVAKDFPNALIGYSAYTDLIRPDLEIPLEQNVAVWVAIYWRDSSRPLAENSIAPINSHFLDVLKQWRRMHNGRLITYSYYMGMNAQKTLPYPMDQVIMRDWKNLKALGIEGATLQNRPDTHEAYALNLLTFSRSAWQDDVDTEALLDEYLEGMYGSAAGEIKPIYNSFHETWRQAEEKGTFIRPNGLSIILLMDALGEKELDNCLQRAREKASNNRERRQVEKLAQAAGYWKMTAALCRLESQANDAARTGDATALVDLKKKAALKGLDLQEYIKHLPAGWAQRDLSKRWTSYTTKIENIQLK